MFPEQYFWDQIHHSWHPSPSLKLFMVTKFTSCPVSSFPRRINPPSWLFTKHVVHLPDPVPRFWHQVMLCGYNMSTAGTLQCPYSVLNAMRSLKRLSNFLQRLHLNPAFSRRWMFALESFIRVVCWWHSSLFDSFVVTFPNIVAPQPQGILFIVSWPCLRHVTVCKLCFERYDPSSAHQK